MGRRRLGLVEGFKQLLKLITRDAQDGCALAIICASVRLARIVAVDPDQALKLIAGNAQLSWAVTIDSSAVLLVRDVAIRNSKTCVGDPSGGSRGQRRVRDGRVRRSGSTAIRVVMRACRQSVLSCIVFQCRRYAVCAQRRWTTDVAVDVASHADVATMLTCRTMDWTVSTLGENAHRLYVKQQVLVWPSNASILQESCRERSGRPFRQRVAGNEKGLYVRIGAGMKLKCGWFISLEKLIPWGLKGDESTKPSEISTLMRPSSSAADQVCWAMTDSWNGGKVSG